MTLILRLLVDDREPEALRGVLQTVVSQEEHAFSDASRLLELLHRMQSDWLKQAPGAQKTDSDSGRG